MTRLRQLGMMGVFAIVASCSGQSCTNGCGGITPIPGGYPRDKAIDNAASLRITRPGLDVLQTELPGTLGKILNAKDGIFLFDIPTTDPAAAKVAEPLGCDINVDAIICKDGPKPNSKPPQCRAQIKVGTSKVTIDAVKPDKIVLKVTVPLKLDDTPVETKISYCGPGSFSPTLRIGYGEKVGGEGCSSANVPTVDYYPLPITVTVPIVAETAAPRTGYTKVDVKNATLDLSGLKTDQVQVCACNGFSLCGDVVNSNTVKGWVLDPIKNALEGTVRDALGEQLCMKPAENIEPPCPTGTKVNGDKCVYPSGACVSTLLGIDGHADLAGLLSKFSPGAEGALDFVVAAGGAMQPFPNANADGAGHTTNGITLAMVGGVQPTPASKCVPETTIEVPKGIPLPDELTKDVIPGLTPNPHVNLALSGRFLNYALGSAYQSGLLCLGISTEQVPQISTGLVSVLIPSVANLAIQQKGAAVAIATRPQQPPRLSLGGGTNIDTDPLIKVEIPNLAIDFYIWSYDRFVRAFTYEASVSLPVNLQTGKTEKNPNGGLAPTLGKVSVTDGKVTNNEQLLEDPAQIAGALTSIIAGLSGQLLGNGIPPIDISAPLAQYGLGLEVPEGGIRKLTKGTDDFLGIFARVTKATAAAPAKAKLASREIHPEAMTFKGFDRAKLPALTFDFSSDAESAERPVEYSYAFDRGARSPWSREAHPRIQDDYFFFQGKHLVRVWARFVGEPGSESDVPAEVPYTIDTLPPEVKLDEEGGKVRLEAWDIVSQDALRVRYRRVNDGVAAGFSEWIRAAEFGPIETAADEAVEVEVQDEEGNIGRASSALIRGRQDGSLTAAGGCSCKTAGVSSGASGSGGLLLAALGVFGFAWRRRRSRTSGSPSMSENGETALEMPAPRRAFASPRTAFVALSAVVSVAATSQGCECGSENGEAEGPQGCGRDCLQECKPGLFPGLVGAYTSAEAAKDGTIWVAGYNDAVLSESAATLYGDLVVGTIKKGDTTVVWESVDGVPKREEGCPDNDRKAWRNGETESGDDVGLWTSLALSQDETPMVAYYDATHRSLKFAFKAEGWKTYELNASPGGDVGRYAKMLIRDGKPVIAFLKMEKNGTGGVRSTVVLARTNDGVPKSPEAWSFEDVAVSEDGACQGFVCEGGKICVKSTGKCEGTSTGCSSCGLGTSCVDLGKGPVCESTRAPDAPETYPDVLGAYIALANGPNGLGIVVYDRPHGNLVAFELDGTKWKQTVLDGEVGSRGDSTAVDTGDVGIGASLFIGEKGTWHVSYASGLEESLRYVTYAGGKVGKVETVDLGLDVEGRPFTDGTHVVGDDSAITVDGNGTIQIFYQDATAGTLRRAKGTSTPDGHRWDLGLIPQDGRTAGFFPRPVGDGKVLNFWRAIERERARIVGDVELLEY